VTFVIEGRKLGTYYEQNHILRGVSIAIRPGETIGPMGRNDMVEASLIRTLSGWTCTTRGRVLIGGRDMTRAPMFAIARCGIACVPERRGPTRADASSFGHLTPGTAI
jgi:branched-chain amino acid transport system ATP-binding protein